MVRWIARLCAAVLAASGLLAATPAPAQPPTAALHYHRLVIKPGEDTAEACLQFSDPLDDRTEAHYGDYLRIEPALTPAIHADGKQLCLGGLAFGTSYKVTLRAGLAATSGARLPADETVDIAIADRPPMTAISGDGWILSGTTTHGLTIQTVNVPRVHIHVLRMSERMLAARLRVAGSFDLTAVQTSGDDLRNLITQDARLVWSGIMEIPANRNHTVETAFPLAGIIPSDPAGAWLVVADSTDKPIPDRAFKPRTDDSYEWSSDMSQSFPAHWVIVSDIGLTTMRGQDGLHVFARSFASANVLPGVRLQLLSTGQEVLGEAATDAAGQAAFPPGLLRGRGAAAPATVIAHGAAGSFAELDLTRAAFDLSDRGVAGRPAPGPVDAFLYTDRGVYRPGETVQLMALLRTAGGAALDNAPLTLVLRRPDNLESRRITLTPAAQAGFHQPLTLSATAARGVWTVEALVDPAGPPAGRVQFDVQDFVPQQLKVTLTAGATALQPGGAIDALVEGRFLYGAPAAGLHGEASIRVVRDPSPVPDAPGYQFGLATETIPGDEQKLDLPDADEAGRTKIDAVFQPPEGIVSPLKAILTAGLFEPTGRIVQDTIELPLHLKPRLIGIRPRENGSAWSSVPSAFDLRVFDADGHPVAGPGLRWTLVREQPHWNWFDAGHGWNFHYYVTDETVDTGAIDVPADRPAVFSHQTDWGNYRLVVADPATGAATSTRFSTGWATAGESADTPDKLSLTADVTTVPAGGTAHLHVRGPFAGKALVTVANEAVIETHSLDVPAEGADIALTATPAWGTGAYVLVSMYRPLAAAGGPHDPVRAMGVAWLATDPAPHTLGVTITAPAMVKPRQRITVPVKVTDLHTGQTAYVTLAAVDEGILQITRFHSPDPNTWFLGKRRLGIDIRDDYGRLLDGSAPAGTIREGGDEEVGGPGLGVTSTRIASLFQGPVAVGPDGTATVSLDIPDFAGALRLMAVAYDHDAVGHAEAALIVRDPVVAEVALPRFLAPGDEAQLSVQVHNLDGDAGDYHLALSTEGPIALATAPALEFRLAVGDRRGASVALTGLDQGVGTVHAELTGPKGLDIRHDWQIAIRAPHYPITVSQTEAQPKGGTYRIDPALLAQFVPGSVSVSLGYSAFAGIDTPGLLQSLYRYPYGCTEQLASSAFPLLYFNDPALLGGVPVDAGVHQRVQAAIDTILDRQDASGQFGLWRVGDGEASAWLNVYALDFLLHAKDAGFTVPDAATRAGMRWLEPVARGDSDDFSNGAYAAEANVTQAYAVYVLARSSRTDPGLLRRIHDGLTWRTNDAGVVPASVRWGDPDQAATPLALGELAGALSLMGDKGRALDTFNLAIANLGVQPVAWWFNRFYYTPERELAGLIAIAAETGNDRLAGALLDRLRARNLSVSRLNTQDKAWLLAAAHALNRGEPSQHFAVNGQTPVAMTLPAAFSPDAAAIRSGFTVQSQASKTLWRTLTVTGAPVAALPAVEHGFALKAGFSDVHGNKIDPAKLRQNDRFIVSLTGFARDKDTHRTVLVDLLPAGWEIEAPVTDPEAYPFLGALSPVRMREARDDRFVAAFDLGTDLNPWFEAQDDSKPHLAANAFRVAFLVRVVTPGHFALPEAVVEDMYRPDLMARTAAGETVAEAR